MKHAFSMNSAVILALALAILSLANEDLLGQSTVPVNEPYLEDGIEAFRNGDLSAAERNFRIAAEHEPKSALAQYWLGVTFVQEHKPAEAEQALLKGLDLQPNFPEAYNQLGILYCKQQLYAKSEWAFSRAITLNPKETNTLFNFGLCFMRQGRPAEALARFDELLKLDPNYTDAYLQQGILLTQLKQFTAGKVFSGKIPRISARRRFWADQAWRSLFQPKKVSRCD